jgi:hypothetical protein
MFLESKLVDDGGGTNVLLQLLLLPFVTFRGTVLRGI